MAGDLERHAEFLNSDNRTIYRDKTATLRAINYVDFFLKKDPAAEICPVKAFLAGHDRHQIEVITEVRRKKWRKAQMEKRDNAIRKLARKPDWTQERIAAHFGLSRGRVQQITQKRPGKS